MTDTLTTPTPAAGAGDHAAGRGSTDPAGGPCPYTEAGRALVARLHEGERFWRIQADEDELVSHVRLTRRSYRDAYREILRWVPALVAEIEQEAAKESVVVSHATGHQDGLCGPLTTFCRCDCIACQSEHWEAPMV